MTNEEKQSIMLDGMGRFRTQSLFLELGYSDEALFTLKDQDHQWNGKNYPSLKRLYLEMADPTEYAFATEYLLGWRHWQRICENKVLGRYVEEWRDELEVKLRSKAIRDAIDAAKTGNFQAAKWVADRGWDTKGRGRPSKAEVERETKIQARINEDYNQDVVRLLRN
jgi:hypothetical protein